MEAVLKLIWDNLGLTVLGVSSLIISIWGLYRRKQVSNQTVIAQRNIRGSSIEKSSEQGSQTVVAGQDIIDSPITQSSDRRSD